MNENIIFEKSYRTIHDGHLAKVYNEKTGIEIAEPISFDSENEKFTSIDYFIGSIVSEIILSMSKVARAKNTILQDVEAKALVEIRNPLYLLNVVGYEEESYISKIIIDIYYFSFLEGEFLEEFQREVLSRTLIYNSFKDKIEVNFKLVL